jgi:urease accessory protein
MADSSAPQVESGWRAELELGFTRGDGRTVLSHRRHLGPLRVQRPFYPEGKVCHVYVVHPPGGVVGGDRLELRVDCGEGAHALLTTPAAGKFYRSGERPQRQQVRLDLHAASLEWLPQETIYYPGATVRQQLLLRLDGASRFFGWEVGCLGLPARAEPFAAGTVTQGFELHVDGRPLLLDRLRLDAAAGTLDAPWGLGGHTVLGTLVAYPATPADLEAALAVVRLDEGAGRCGLSLVDGVLVGRCFGYQAERVRRLFAVLWQELRPRLLGRPAQAPRIWAT